LVSGLDPHGLYGSVTHDPLWTPSRKVDFSTPPPVTTATGGTSVSVVAPVASIGKFYFPIKLNEVMNWIIFSASDDMAPCFTVIIVKL
jgi:hypothetical protein